MGNIQPRGLHQNHNMDQAERAFPGLKSALKDIRKYHISSEDYDRQFLWSIQNVPGFKTAFDELSDDYKEKLMGFINGRCAERVAGNGFSFPDQHIMKHYRETDESNHTVDPQAGGGWEGEERISIWDGEDQSKLAVVYRVVSSENRNENLPTFMYILTTIAGVQNIIRHLAFAGNKRIRVADAQHLWSAISCGKSDVLISLASPPTSGIAWPTEFNQIELDSDDMPGSNGGKRRVRIGAAVTNEEFRAWSVESGWALPSNVQLIGSFLCYGFEHGGNGDFITDIEYVDAKGNHQRISDSQHINALAGSLGILGVITHVSLELERMTYAVLHPIKQDLLLAIPPPLGYNIPEGTDVHLSDYPQQLLEDAEQNFISMARWDYSEWSWTPFSKQVCVNCWWTTDDPIGAENHLDSAEVFLQWEEGWAARIMNEDPGFISLTGRLQAQINAEGAMSSLLPRRERSKYPLKTHLIDAQYKNPKQQIPNLELLFPIPALSSNPEKPDWGILQHAWWDTIALVYADLSGGMRVGLNMRILSSSGSSIMEPQANNRFGTVSIKISTNSAAVSDGTWQQFAQMLVDKLSRYEVGGKKLQVRPNWATGCEGLKIHGEDWRKYLKEVSHKEEIDHFEEILSKIGEGQGWKIKELKERFSNSLVDNIMYC